MGLYLMGIKKIISLQFGFFSKMLIPLLFWSCLLTQLDLLPL